MSRKLGSNGARLEQHDKDIDKLKSETERLKNDAEKIKNQYESHIERHIIDDLSTERFPGAGKPLYSYSDIAERYNVSTSKVQRIARENGLTRRNSETA